MNVLEGTLNNVFYFSTVIGQFSCDVKDCVKKFSRNCELTRHKLNHTDVWPFTCEAIDCGRKFKRKDIYRNHIKTHKKLDFNPYRGNKSRNNTQAKVTNISSSAVALACKESLQDNSQPAIMSEVWSTDCWDQNIQNGQNISISLISAADTIVSTSNEFQPSNLPVHTLITTGEWPSSQTQVVQSWNLAQPELQLIHQNCEVSSNPNVLESCCSDSIGTLEPNNSTSGSVSNALSSLIKESAPLVEDNFSVPTEEQRHEAMLDACNFLPPIIME